jgi:multiple antibiotic resistance protein
MPDAAQIFTFLFLMLGPFKIIGPFAQLTQAADPPLARKMALLAFLYSSIALLLAAIIGEAVLTKFGIPLPILAMAGGIILFLVALLNIIRQFAPYEAPTNHVATPPTLNMAVSPLAFPTIVTPYGIAAVIVFMALSPDLHAKLLVGALVLVIMLINLGFMMMGRKALKIFLVILPVLGAILGVVQVALGLMVIYNQFKILFP